ncbi:hypothetical protein MAJ_10259, partial [Metarhizium majus ARSEF 297]
MYLAAILGLTASVQAQWGGYAKLGAAVSKQTGEKALADPLYAGSHLNLIYWDAGNSIYRLECPGAVGDLSAHAYRGIPSPDFEEAMRTFRGGPHVRTGDKWCLDGKVGGLATWPNPLNSQVCNHDCVIAISAMMRAAGYSCGHLECFSEQPIAAWWELSGGGQCRSFAYSDRFGVTEYSQFPGHNTCEFGKDQPPKTHCP